MLTPKNLVEIGSDIVGMDKCCMDKFHPDVWHIVRLLQKPLRILVAFKTNEPYPNFYDSFRDIRHSKILCKSDPSHKHEHQDEQSDINILNENVYEHSY